MIIEVTVSPEGKVVTKVLDGCGKSCADATKTIRDAIGETVEDRKLPEFYGQANPKQGIKQGGS